MDTQIVNHIVMRAPPSSHGWPGRQLDLEDIVLCPISTQRELARVVHLRDGIDLSTHARRDDFLALEKKEMSWVSWSVLNWAANR